MTPDFEQRLAQIESRNQRVAEDKAWETSLVRRAVIAAITYVFAVLLLIVIRADLPFAGAVMPVMGYLLSTLALPPIRKIWQGIYFGKGLR
jgi:hypothetical protein